MFRALNHEVVRLQRISFGEYVLGDLAPGMCIEVSKVDSSAVALADGSVGLVDNSAKSTNNL